jgi:cyanophycinase
MTEYGAVALVGSGEYLPQMEDVDRMLLATLGDGPHTVALVPTASALEPGMPEYWNRLGLLHFQRFGVQVEPLLVLGREDAHRQPNVDSLAESDFIYFSGGNPLHIVEAWRDTPAWAMIQERRRQGAVLAGCSAGAMMMGGVTLNIRTAISGGAPEWVPALGVVPELAILPHFDRLRERTTPDRFAALLECVPEGITVVGVDEDTALVRFRTHWQVLGRQGVSIFDGAGHETRYAAGEHVPLG